jgi:hypothetical protein
MFQETLETYGVRHDQFDFESELGWEGSNDKFLTIMKNSPYFVPQTYSNAQGMPQGAYFDFTKFISDQGFPTGASTGGGGRGSMSTFTATIIIINMLMPVRQNSFTHLRRCRSFANE